MEERKIWIDHPSEVLNYHYYFIYGVFVLIGWKVAWPTILGPLIFWYYRRKKLKSTRYELTDQRLFIKSGMMNSETEFIELYRIKEYLIKQPWYFKYFNLSDLVLKPINSSMPSVCLKAVHNPVELRDEIRYYSEAMRDNKRGEDFSYWDAGN